MNAAVQSQLMPVAMAVYRSFRAYLDSVIVARGYEMRRPGRWYRRVLAARLVVAAEPKRFEPGVYVEYGLTYDFLAAKYPRPSECLIFGDNPAMSEPDFRCLRELLRDVQRICRDPAAQAEVSAAVHKQLDCLESWANPAVLWRRVKRGKVNQMLYNGVDFEGDFLGRCSTAKHGAK